MTLFILGKGWLMDWKGSGYDLTEVLSQNYLVA
jgi:hypothetical protein